MAAPDLIESLRAQIEQLKAENAKLRAEQDPVQAQQEQDEPQPSLRSRVPLDVLFRKPESFLGQVIGVAGWIRTTRKGGGGTLGFVKLDDGTTPEELQLLVTKDTPGFEHINNTGAALFAVGEIVESKGKEQAFELKASSVELLGACPPADYPLAGKAHSLEYLRSVAHLRPRTKALAAVARVRNALSFAVHAFFQAQGFVYVHTPLITCSDCEGGGEMFQVTTLLPEPEREQGVAAAVAVVAADGAAEEGKEAPVAAAAAGDHHSSKSYKKQVVTLDYSKDFFKKPAFLTVSGQLNVETYCQALSNVYTFGPTFRAEISHTSRHLAEFWMIEPELAFADLKDDMRCAEAFLKFCISEALRTCDGDLAYLEEFEKKQEVNRAQQEKENKKREQQEQAAKMKALREQSAKDGQPLPEQVKPKKQKKKVVKAGKSFKSTPLRERLQQVVAKPFAHITYTQAIDRLTEAVEASEVDFVVDVIEWGMDLGSEHEKFLCEQVYQRPLIVTDYPKDIKAFYMRLNPDGRTVAAMDILVPGLGEIIGGSQREERLEHLEKRMQEMAIAPAEYEWYLDLRRYGSVPHAGFGLGFERLVCYATGMDNIRDVIPFPRTEGRADF